MTELREHLREASERVEATYPENTELTIDQEGTPHLKRLPAQPLPEDLETIEVCQSQPVKIAWRPLRLLIATIIYLRGLVKREDIRDIDLFARNDDFFDQTLGNDLPIGKGEAIEVLA